MSDLPAPMVPEDCDLSGMDSMMLDVGRLRKSRLALVAKRRPELGWISVLLWGAAWNETPAASIENDDDVLADRAMLSPERWADLKEDALKPWILCSNGRWYHPVVAEKANELWAGRLRKRHEMENGRAVKAWKAAGSKGDAPRIEFLPWLEEHFPATYPMRDVVFGSDKGSKTKVATPVTDGEAVKPTSVTGSVTEPKTPENALKEKVKVKQKDNVLSVEDKSSTGASAAKTDLQEKKPDDPWREVYRRGREILGNSAGGVITNLRKTFNDKPRKVLAKLEDAAEQRNPSEWINAFLWQHGPPGLEGIDTSGGLI